MSAASPPYVVLCGNPIDGLTFYGPFPSGAAATEWAERALDNAGDWWVSELVGP
jgi:hypothetical protein